MARAKSKELIVKKELPSLLCQKCRLWIETQERHNMFERVDGALQAVTAWTCPACRGEAGAVVTVAAKGNVTQADVARDERLGPYKTVQRDTVVLNASGKTARAKLECGHDCCVLPDAVKARCRKCVAKRAA